MGDVQLYNGDPLLVDGAPAIDPACCCGPTCCTDPPSCMELKPPDDFGSIGVAGGRNSFIEPGGGPTTNPCGAIGDAPYELLDTNPQPSTGENAIDNWAGTLPGTFVMVWRLTIEEFAQVYVNRALGPPIGCEDHEDDLVDLYLQLALREIEGECYYFSQVAWANSDASIARWYNYRGDGLASQNGGLNSGPLSGTPYDCTNVLSYGMEFDPSTSKETSPPSATEYCWGCSATDKWTPSGDTGGLLVHDNAVASICT